MQWSDLKFWKEGMAPGVPMEAIPSAKVAFRAFDLCPFDDVKVVILGQDPYHTPGVADGLAFSTWPHIRKKPPSLRVIHGEYSRDLGYPGPSSNSLEPWARHGCLLLNTCPVVLPNRPGSLMGQGWERLAIEVIQRLNRDKSGIVYMLWGRKAQEYAGRINAEQNLLLIADHPSPINPRSNFPGCAHFSKACAYLKLEKHFWRLP